MITYSVRLSLGPASSIKSGVAVREIAAGNLIYVDKVIPRRLLNLEIWMLLIKYKH